MKCFVSHRFVIFVSLIAVFTVLFSFQNTFAANCGGVNTSIIDCEEGGSGPINHVLRLVIDILTIGVGILAVVGIAWTGIQYLSAGSNEEKTKKAKRRIYEVVLGVACYAVLWGFSQWLLPNGNLNPDADTSNVTGMTLKYSKKSAKTNGKSFKLSVTFNEDANNTTYSLVSNKPDVVSTQSSSLKCLKAGKAKVTAVAANGLKATTTVECKEEVKPDESSNSIGTAKNGIAADGSKAASDGSATVGSQEKVKLKGTPHLRTETAKIIKEHDKDFYWKNFDSFMKKHGGYNKYVQSLGGVFGAYASHEKKNGHIKRMKVRTAADFQAAAEYVFGLWEIYGVDYNNGTYSHHPYWGDPDQYDYGNGHLGKDTSAFWYQYPDRANFVQYRRNNINAQLRSMPIYGIGCDIAADILYHSIARPSIGSTCSSARMRQMSPYRKNNGSIWNWDEVKVGDVIYFRSGPRGAHVAVAGEVYKDYVVIYDGGSYFQHHKDFKYKVPRVHSGSLRNTPWYGCYHYLEAIRPYDIDQSVTLKGLN